MVDYFEGKDLLFSSSPTHNFQWHAHALTCLHTHYTPAVAKFLMRAVSSALSSAGENQ